MCATLCINQMNHSNYGNIFIITSDMSHETKAVKQGSWYYLKSMNFDVQLHLMSRHAIFHPQPVLEVALDIRLMWLKHFHRRVVHL